MWRTRTAPGSTAATDDTLLLGNLRRCIRALPLPASGRGRHDDHREPTRRRPPTCILPLPRREHDRGFRGEASACARGPR